MEQLGLFLEDFRDQGSRTLELDREIIVQLNKFLKEHKSSQMGKGLYEALYWLNKFISYFEQDHEIMVVDTKELMEEPEENLTDEDKLLKKEQKKFMNTMFKEQFPDIVEIILIYTYRK